VRRGVAVERDPGMGPDRPADREIVQRVICPVCAAEAELGLPARVPDRCVAVERVRCASCGVERTIFLKFPDEEERWGPQ